VGLRIIAPWGLAAGSTVTLGFELGLMCALVWAVAWLMILPVLPGSAWVKQ
jgi:hypothetical protein